MTKIFIFKKENLYSGFEMNGHANKFAGDILCATLYFLSINTYNSIEKICSLTKEDMNLKVDDGYFKIFIELKYIDEERIRSIQTLFKSFEIGVLSLKKEYNKYIEVYYKEV